MLRAFVIFLSSASAKSASTREEYLEKSSLVPGQAFLLHFFGGLFGISR